MVDQPRTAYPACTTENGSDSDDPVPVYYPGTEISGFMPRRGDFATVSIRQITFHGIRRCIIAVTFFILLVGTKLSYISL